VLGLIQVTGHLVEPSQLGTGIAVAFVATLYGLALANLVFLPLCGKMRAHIESELRLRKLYLDGLLAISRKETPHTIATRLAGEIGGRGEANAWARQNASAGVRDGATVN
jgi:chemotaxis protein MotA